MFGSCFRTLTVILISDFYQNCESMLVIKLKAFKAVEINIIVRGACGYMKNESCGKYQNSYELCVCVCLRCVCVCVCVCAHVCV